MLSLLPIPSPPGSSLELLAGNKVVIETTDNISAQQERQNIPRIIMEDNIMPFVLGKTPVTTFEATTAVQDSMAMDPDTFTLSRTVSSVQDSCICRWRCTRHTSIYNTRWQH